MNLITYYRKHVWKWTPGGDPVKDLQNLSAEDRAKLEKEWREYLQNTTAHKLTVNLLDEEWEYIDRKAREYGLSRSQLIEQFIKDFAGYRRNGSDEEDAAENWYNRNRCNYEWRDIE